MCLASQENWLQGWRLVKWALQTVKLKSFAENVSQLFLYQMLQETKWENLFHLNQQIIAKSLPGLIHTHSKSICLARWLPYAGWVVCSSSATSVGSKVWDAVLKLSADNFQWSLGSSLQSVPSHTLWLPWPLCRCVNGTWEACVQSW